MSGKHHFLYLLLLIFAWDFALANKDISNTQSQLDDVAKQINSLIKDISSKEEKRQKIYAEIQQSDIQIVELSDKLDKVKQQLNKKQAHISKLKNQLAASQSKLDREQNILSRQIRSAYMMGQQEKIKTLLNQQDADAVNRAMVYHDYLSKARSQQIKQTKQQIADLETIQNSIRQEETDLLLLKVESENQFHILANSQNKREALIAYLNDDIKDKDLRVKELKKDHQALKKLLAKLTKQAEIAAKKAADEAKRKQEELEKQAELAKKQKDKAKQKRIAQERKRQQAKAEAILAKNSSFAKRKGHFFWPTTGKLQARFGSSKASGLASDGVIIQAKAGQTVKAIHPGRVVFAEWMRGYGLLIILDHGKGYMSLYGHNQKLLKKVGDMVETNTPISKTGKSGGLTEPALYFGIRVNGKALNPAKWCQKIIGGEIK